MNPREHDVPVDLMASATRSGAWRYPTMSSENTDSGSGNVQLHLRLPPDVADALRTIAMRRSQTISGAVCYILGAHLRSLRAATGDPK